MTVELLDQSGRLRAKTGRGVVLLPQIIPPDQRRGGRNASEPRERAGSSTERVSTQDLRQYARSTLTIKDNQPANLTTSRTELECWAEYDGDEYVQVGGNTNKKTEINWYKTGADESKFHSDGTYVKEMDFYGNFPAGIVTDWTAFHQHYHDFEVSQQDPSMFCRIKKRVPHTGWRFHKDATWHGSQEYPIGSKQTAKLYIL